jgi:alpha/beta superfamily hydrolase
MSLPEHLVVFAHGKESGPWGIKITRLAETARRRGFEVLSPDYSQTPDPRRRVEQLLALAPEARGALVLVGSSMGSYVSAMACAEIKPDALFLMAPAFYFPGYDEEPAAAPITSVVHGWADDIVPAERALRYAQRHRARLLMLDAGHTLNERLPELDRAFDNVLTQARQHAAYRLADYSVETALGTRAIAIDRGDPELDHALVASGIRANWALITACNPLGLPPGEAENRERQAQLAAQIATDGHTALPALGGDPAGQWPAEPSLLLVDPPAGYAEALAHHYVQNAILIGRIGEPTELRWLRG